MEAVPDERDTATVRQRMKGGGATQDYQVGQMNAGKTRTKRNQKKSNRDKESCNNKHFNKQIKTPLKIARDEILRVTWEKKENEAHDRPIAIEERKGEMMETGGASCQPQ